MFVTLLATFLICLGSLVSLLFWVPKLVNRPRLKELLGPRYPMVYLIYLANGPLLVVLGILIRIRFG